MAAQLVMAVVIMRVAMMIVAMTMSWLGSRDGCIDDGTKSNQHCRKNTEFNRNNTEFSWTNPKHDKSFLKVLSE